MDVKFKICIMRSSGTIAPFVMDDIVEALRFAGHEVLVIDMAKEGMYDQLDAEGMKQLATRIFEQLQEFKPDYAFSYGSAGVITLGGEDNLTNLFEYLEIPYVLFFYDGPLDNKDFLTSFKDSELLHVICWDKAYLHWLKEIGLKKVFYQPLGTNIRRFCPVANSSIQYDTSFVGSIDLEKLANGFAKDAELASYQQEFLRLKLENPTQSFIDMWHDMEQVIPEDKQAKFTSFQQTPQFEHFMNDTFRLGDNAYRKTMISAIANQDHKITVFGNDSWQQLQNPNIDYQGFIDYQTATANIYRTSKININLTNSHLITALNQRVFDVSACGGFILTDYRADLEDLFSKDEVICFKTEEELLSKLEYYLSHDKERLEISNFLSGKVREIHSWDKRMEQLFNDYLS